ncbi:MAG: type II toxin-antitoxin system HipA family toxin [Deltaproteobacteria bacterium]|nr:type II toxin-antitoxin system HipA family toxin [Deltaproteobacteria bacterium]
MSREHSAPYAPGDRLYLWILTTPENPRWVGEIDLLRRPRGVSFRYAPEWLSHGFPLSEDLPLIDTVFVPSDQDAAPGAIDDARPNRWGERLIRFVDKPPRLSLLEYLYFAGDDRFGALGISMSSTEYRPRRTGPLPRLDDVDEVSRLVQRVLANEPIPPEKRRLISPGVTMGGAHPKALIDIDGAQWIVKFSAGEHIDLPLVEHATMTLATKANIVCAKTHPIRLIDGHALAVRRFDREGSKRVHSLSARVALAAAGEPYGYPELAQLLRRRGRAAAGFFDRQMQELFRRMVFNILIDNTDDHEKNHVLLLLDSQEYELSPAFDVLPSGQALGYQQMRVGHDESDSTIDNALSMCEYFGLSRDEAVNQVREVVTVISDWKKHFAAEGVLPPDIASLEAQIDRAFLRSQRDEFC